MSKEKKTFKEDMEQIAEIFITPPAPQEQPAQPSPSASEAEQVTTPQATPKAPKGWHYDPRLIENKSARLQLLVKPSTVEWLKARAAREGTSLNAMCNIVFEEAMAREAGKE